MTKGKFIKMTAAKPGQDQVNEDSVVLGDSLMAVSDGAGGGGMYADKWSAHIVSRLPPKPIKSFETLDEWVGEMWKPFYDKYELEAQAAGVLALQKFYDEGSFATLAAAWIDGNVCRWIAYGDSVVFHYQAATGQLSHSFTYLCDFNRPPYLISLHDPLIKKAFRPGEYTLQAGDVVICASDALAHYILMQYELAHRDEYRAELDDAVVARTGNSVHIMVASSLDTDFGRDVIGKLVNCNGDDEAFRKHMESLLRKGLISLDDYSCTIYTHQP